MATRLPIMVVDGDLADVRHSPTAPGTGPEPQPQPATADDRYMLSARVRAAAVVYAVVAVPVIGWLARSTQGERAYFMALGATIVPYVLPLLVAGWQAIRRSAAVDRVTWRLWFSVSCAAIALSAVLYLTALHGLDRGKTLAPVGAGVATLGIAVANTLMLRRRSGQRTAMLDAIDLLMATVALIVPVALVVAEPIVTSPHAWFTVACALAAVGWCHGLLVALVLVARLQPGERVVAALGAGVGGTAVVASVAQTIQGMNGFAYPSGAFVAAHAACFSMILLFYCFAGRRPAVGLDRFPAQQQVRRSGAVALAVLVAVPVIAVEAWVWRDRSWVVATAVAAGLGLVVLSCIRHLLLVDETTRLYREVERAAEERKCLLADVMAHADRDRGRVAAHLHRQAVSLHTAIASFAGALEAPAGGVAPAVAGMAAERMRLDLARHIEWLRQILTVVAPADDRYPGPERLTAPIRAYVGNLYGDSRQPQLTVDADPELDLDWTTEVVAFRIVQEAIDNIWRHAGASSVHVSLAAPDQLLEIEVADDGAGFDPAAVRRESGIATMRALAEFAGGRLEVTSAPGHGAQVRAVLGGEAPAPAARADLRVVSDN